MAGLPVPQVAAGGMFTGLHRPRRAAAARSADRPAAAEARRTPVDGDAPNERCIPLSIDQIRERLAQAGEHFRQHPKDALSEDAPAVATLEGGLRCRAHGPAGMELLSDMPAALGGQGSAPTPGWLLRAALANCDATVIAMRAAQLGIRLTRLEITAGSRSDDRGLLGMPDAPAGPLEIHLTIRIAAEGVSPDRLHDLVGWAERHSPVGDALRRVVPVHAEVIVEESGAAAGTP